MDRSSLTTPDQLYQKFKKTKILELWEQAKISQQNAYAKYSNFKVGAAILDDQNNIHTGCNYENAAYPLSNCAENGAIGKMISHGNYNIKTILVVGKSDDNLITTPCGGCRQQISEFADPDTPIIIANNQDILGFILLEQLLPFNFSSRNL